MKSFIRQEGKNLSELKLPSMNNLPALSACLMLGMSSFATEAKANDPLSSNNPQASLISNGSLGSNTSKAALQSANKNLFNNASVIANANYFSGKQSKKTGDQANGQKPEEKKSLKQILKEIGIWAAGIAVVAIIGFMRFIKKDNERIDNFVRNFGKTPDSNIFRDFSNKR